MALRSRRRPRQLGLTGCGLALLVGCGPAWGAEEPPHPVSLDEAIIRSAARHGIPESLVRRVVMRESKYNPRARNHSFWGLMQISYPTAKSMGFHGTPQQLLNPIVNLRYAVPYLANAFVIAGKRQDAAVRLYAHGYYEAAKHRGLLGDLRTADSAPLAAVPDDTEVAAAAPPPPPQESGGLFGALFGPSEMPRDAATQQAVYASAAPEQPPQPAAEPAPQVASAAPNGHADDEVALVADKHGALQPPKAWKRDGGTTVIARGEQSVEQVAAYAKSADAADAHSSRHRHSRKTTVFAALDTAPASAQAYAATADGQDPRLAQSESQAAIAQATAGQQAADPAPAAPAEQQTAQGQQPAPPAATAAADATPSAKKGHKRRTARRSHHHDTEQPATAVAAAPAPDPAQQPAAAGEPQPAQAAEAAPPQPAPADATAQAPPPGYPGAAPDAQPQQQAAADPAETTPSPKRKHHTRHARARKTTDVAAQAPDDGRAPSPPAPPPQSQTQ